MPKLESPFIREMIDGEYIVTSKINPKCSWVFEKDTVLAIEKLDGTCVSVVIKNGIVTKIYNREERINFIDKHTAHITHGILESCTKEYLDSLGDGQFFGELIGEKVNGNPLGVVGHIWIPFSTYAQNHLSYTSWGKYPKTFDAISNWFENDLFSLFIRRRQRIKKPPEGIVFVDTETGKMAKLRRDQFSWFNGRGHKGKTNIKN